MMEVFWGICEIRSLMARSVKLYLFENKRYFKNSICGEATHHRVTFRFIEPIILERSLKCAGQGFGERRDYECTSLYVTKEDRREVCGIRFVLGIDYADD
jgi:hypothetical protein